LLYLNFESPMAFWMINRHMSNKQDESLYQGIYSQQDCVMITNSIGNQIGLDIETYKHEYDTKCFVVPIAALIQSVKKELFYSVVRITFICDSSDVYSDIFFSHSHETEGLVIEFVKGSD